MKHFGLHILLLMVLLITMVACKEKTTTTTYSEALVTSFSFSKDSRYPGLTEATYTIITQSDTGRIYSRDSLMYGTCLDSVVPHITFNHVPSYAMIITPTDTVVYSGADTLNLSHGPIYLYVLASDQESEKWYTIDLTVHHVDPDYYQWDMINSGIYAADGAESRALYQNGTFYLFVNNGFANQLYTSTDAATWSAPSAVTGLPSGCLVRQMMLDSAVFYYADAEGLYTSNDGFSFTKQDYSSQPFVLQSMLYAFNDSVWAIATRKSDDKLVMVNMAKGGTLKEACVLPDNFPISDFATLTFRSAALRARAMVVGGHDRLGQASNMRWNIEFTPNRGYAMGDFSIEQPSYEALSGVSLVWYNHAIHMFGSMNKDAEVAQQTQWISYDEGLHWEEPDTAHNRLPEAYRPRQKASVIATPDHYIYIIGGQSRTASFSDVWRGRLNETYFSEYEE